MFRPEQVINYVGLPEVTIQMLQAADFPFNNCDLNQWIRKTYNMRPGQYADSYFDIRREAFKPITVRVVDSNFDDPLTRDNLDKMALFTSKGVGQPWVMNKDVATAQKYTTTRKGDPCVLVRHLSTSSYEMKIAKAGTGYSVGDEVTFAVTADLIRNFDALANSSTPLSVEQRWVDGSAFYIERKTEHAFYKLQVETIDANGGVTGLRAQGNLRNGPDYSESSQEGWPSAGDLILPYTSGTVVDTLVCIPYNTGLLVPDGDETVIIPQLDYSEYR